MDELGRLERLNPRDHWRDEARDFTPWLRENIDLLGEALGLELDQAVDSEVRVGAFAADLLATDLGTGGVVLIENQLEDTDHSHLGQLVTYASRLDAHVVVWIARRFRDEHRQALTWLNENTLEDVRFFGVEIELVQIGDSARAPNLKVQVTPSEWQKSGAVARTSQATDKQQRYREFWASLIADIREREPTFTSSRPETAPKQNWCSFSVGRSGFQDNPVFWVGERRSWLSAASGALHRHRRQGPQQRAFDALVAERSAIEAEYGASLNWTRRDDINASRIYVSRPGSIDDPAEALDGHRTWFVENLFRIRDVFGPRVKSLVLD